MNVCYKWVLGAIFVFSSMAANAQAVNGVLRVVKGDVQIKSGKDGKTVKARVGEKVFPKDTIITAADSRAKIVMVDNNEINVSPDSQIEIQNYEFDPAAGKKDVLLNVIYGKVRNKVEQKYDGKTSKFQIKTPSAVAGVRGTDFLTGYVNGATNIVTFQGKVEFGLPGPGGTIKNPVFVTPGTQASNTSGSAPTPPAPVPKDQLAKMDNDSKADSGKSDGKGDSRQPADDKKGKKDKDGDKADKKDGDGKKDGDAKKDGDGKKDGDAKKDGDGKKGDNNGKADGNKGADNNKGGGDGNKGSGGGGNGAGGGVGGVAGGPGSPGGGDAGGSGNRGPASDGGNVGAGPGPGGMGPGPSGPAGGTGPVAGGCTMCDVGPGPGGGGPMMLPPPPLPTFIPPMPVAVGPPPICAACIDIPQTGNSKLIIHVNTGP